MHAGYSEAWAQSGGGHIPPLLRQWGYNMPCFPTFSL